MATNRHSRTMLGLCAAGLLTPAALASDPPGKPNLVYVFADQWRAQATGYAGDPNLQGRTPNLDQLAAQSVNLRTAVSTCPVCTPYRGSLLTGQYPLTHGLFVNDVQLAPEALTLGKIYQQAGYDTAYIGKWHLDGRGRSAYIPEERRQGFEHCRMLECTHSYNNSAYYADNDSTKRVWEGYDALAQTRAVQQYLRQRAEADKPFCLLLSWGPPHAPYQTAPKRYRDLFDPEAIELRPNVEKDTPNVRQALAGYYAHIAALDDCLGELLATIDKAGLADNTIFVFTSDHGDLLGSHGQFKKQQPYDESIRVPFLIRYPAGGVKERQLDMPLGTPDILPTLLSLSGIDIPATVEGTDYAPVLAGQRPAPDNAALIECLHPFGQWWQGREYRGLRTSRYTYVRDRTGPWLLFDNEQDPYQQTNLVEAPESEELLSELDQRLSALLADRGDEFLDGMEYIRQWGYKVNDRGTVPYTN